MSDGLDPIKMMERYVEQLVKMAAEAGQMLDKTMDVMEKSSREFIGTASQQTKVNAEEIKRLASDALGLVKQDIPKVRSELREMEARARDKLRELERR